VTNHILDREFSRDYLRWVRMSDHLVDNATPSKLEEMQQEIIKNNDYSSAFFFCTEYNYKHYKMQKIVINSKSPKYSLSFARHVKNADVVAFQNILLEAFYKDNNIKYLCQFACFVPDADLSKIESMVLKTNQAQYAHMLIKHIKSINVNKFKKIIFESKKPSYIFELAKSLKGKDFNKAQRLIIESKSATYIRLFAQKLKEANVPKLEEAILETQNIKEIKKFAKMVKNSKIKNFSVLF